MVREIQIMMCVADQDHLVTVKLTHQLLACKVAALLATNHQGPFNRWEVRDQNGTLLDNYETLDNLGVLDGDRLFVSLQIGIGA